MPQQFSIGGSGGYGGQGNLGDSRVRRKPFEFGQLAGLDSAGGSGGYGGQGNLGTPTYGKGITTMPVQQPGLLSQGGSGGYGGQGNLGTPTYGKGITTMPVQQPGLLSQGGSYNSDPRVTQPLYGVSPGKPDRAYSTTQQQGPGLLTTQSVGSPTGEFGPAPTQGPGINAPYGPPPGGYQGNYGAPPSSQQPAPQQQQGGWWSGIPIIGGIVDWLGGSSDPTRDQNINQTTGIGDRLATGRGPFDQPITDIANGMLQPGRFDGQMQNTIANMANNPYEGQLTGALAGLSNPTQYAGQIAGYGTELAGAGPYEGNRNTIATQMMNGPQNYGAIQGIATDLRGTNPYNSQLQGLTDRLTAAGSGGIDLARLGGGMATAGMATAGTASASSATASLADAIAGSANGDIAGLRGVGDRLGQFSGGTAETLGQDGLATQRLAGMADTLMSEGRTSREDALMSLGLQGNAANEQLMAQMAARGLGNSGAAAAAMGGLTGNLIGQRAQLQRQLDQEQIDRTGLASSMLNTSDQNNLQRIGQNNSAIAQRLGLDLQGMGQQADSLRSAGSLAQADDQLRTNVNMRNADNLTNVSQGNAQMATQASISNAGNQTQASVANAGNQTQVSLQNSDQQLRAAMANQQNELQRLGMAGGFLNNMSDDRYRSLTGSAGILSGLDQSSLGYLNSASDSFGGLEASRQNRLNGGANILQGVDSLQNQRTMAQIGGYDNQAGRYDGRQQNIFGAQNTMQQSDWQRMMQAAGLFSNQNDSYYRNLMGAGSLYGGLSGLAPTPTNGGNLFNGLMSLAPAIIGAAFPPAAPVMAAVAAAR